MSGGYRFDDNDDEGIFNEPIMDAEGLGGQPSEVTGAAGDPAAAEDILLQGWVPGIQMSVGPDGLVEVMDMGGERGILDPPPPVDAVNLICMAHCRHYTENAQLVSSGPDPDAEEHVEIGRWCGAVRTWAEQTDLTEFECFACTHFEPDMRGDPEVVRSAVIRNAQNMAEVIKQSIDEKVPLGICVAGPCEHFVGQVGSTPSDHETTFYRWCTKLGGLGRLYDLRDHPVLCCNSWKPISNSPTIGAVAVENIQRMAKYRKEMAERSIEEE